MNNGVDLIKKIESLYELKERLTALELNNEGVTRYNISWLLNSGYVVRRSRGVYELGEVNVSLEKDDKTIYTLFLRAINDNDYEMAKEYLEMLYEYTDNKEDVVVLLGLMEFLINIDDKYSSKVHDLKEKLNYEKKSKTKREMVYAKCLTGLFGYAKQRYHSLNDDGVFDDGLEILIRINTIKKRELEFIISDYIAKRDYEELKTFLHSERERHNLIRRDKAIMHLLDVYFEMLETGVVYPKTDNNPQNLFGAIRCNDFELARSYVVSYRENSKSRTKEDPLYLLLDDIVALEMKLTDNTTKNRGVLNISELERLASLESSTPYNVDEVIDIFELNCEEAAIYKLIFARRSYSIGNIMEGNRLIKEVEKSREKPILVKKMLQEIKDNKVLIINRWKHRSR